MRARGLCLWLWYIATVFLREGNPVCDHFLSIRHGLGGRCAIGHRTGEFWHLNKVYLIFLAPPDVHAIFVHVIPLSPFLIITVFG